MPLITGSNTLNNEFTPATGAFVAQAAGCKTDLLRRVSGGVWHLCGTIENGQSVDVPNSVAGFSYKFVSQLGGKPSVAAYQ